MADYWSSEGRISVLQLCLEILETLGNVRYDLHQSPHFLLLWCLCWVLSGCHPTSRSWLCQSPGFPLAATSLCSPNGALQCCTCSTLPESKWLCARKKWSHILCHLFPRPQAALPASGASRVVMKATLGFNWRSHYPCRVSWKKTSI